MEVIRGKTRFLAVESQEGRNEECLTEALRELF